LTPFKRLSVPVMPTNETDDKPTILVTDDDAMTRMLTRQCLEAENMVVLEAENGPAAIDLFVRESPDLVFLDVQMPGMSGLEVCERIRRMPQGRDVPIMLVTGADDQKSIDRGFRAGATQYKTKPVNWTLLGRDVKFMLRAAENFEALKRQEDRLRYLAYYDPLTSLPNRRSFTEELDRLVLTHHSKDSFVAVLFIDLDHFKRINDSIGHARGDRLLVEIAKRLVDELKPYGEINLLSDFGDYQYLGGKESIIIARLGGDEFTVVLPNIKNEEGVTEIARKILKSLSQPVALQSHNPVVTPSIGVAMFPRDGTDPDTLVRNADTAMYAAKSMGRSCFRFYQDDMNSSAVELLKMEEELREALTDNQLVLHYQPLVNSMTGEVSGLEALARWNHPERGMISPAAFIPVAEQTGQIIELTSWVIREAIKDCNIWEQAGFSDFKISVNISALEFNHDDLASHITSLFQEVDFNKRRVQLELTESAIMTDAQANIKKLSELCDLGVTLAVDDFGTGYSSLSYLRQFPINVLKIDRSFVMGIGTEDGNAIVDAITSLAKALRLGLVAEGVETKEQMEYLIHNGCDTLQGFYLSRPVPARDIIALLTKPFDI